MKIFQTPSAGETKSATKTVAIVSFSLALATIFWLASSPVAGAAAATPAEMLQSNLPASMNVANAPKDQLLSAICKSVSLYQKEAPDIVRTAAGARQELTGDILEQTVRCLHGDAHSAKATSCDLIRSTLNEAIAIQPTQTATLSELVGNLAPTCLDSPTEGPGGIPANVNAARGPGGGGTSGASAGKTSTVTPGQTSFCSVCHNNENVQVDCDNQAAYLATHPGDTPGACQATAEVNR